MAARLTHAPLWQVRAMVDRAAEASAAAVLEESFGIAPVSYTEPESQTVQLSVYLSAAQRPTRHQFSLIRVRLMQASSPRRVGAPPSLEVRRLANRDWRHSWKCHFQPLHIGGKLLLRPSWSRCQARRGEAVVVLDPGLSFGTGQHATTRFCLEEVVRMRKRDLSQSLLDLGTGSGILAIAAAKLGYQPILALDNDPECVRVALSNARRNRVAQRLTLRKADVARLSQRPRQRHDLVCANLLAPLLVEQADRMVRQVQPGGCLTVAGILDREFPSVAARLTRLGGVLERQRVAGEWHSATYRFPR
jgi:ribosomal protein L11 methyltransferase